MSPSTSGTSRQPSPSGIPRAKKKTVLDSFVIRTSSTQKAEIDEQVARMVFATNSPFRLVEHPEFVKMAEFMRPGYKPPSRQDVADKYLPQVYEQEVSKCVDILRGSTVCLGLDGWSNVHNEPNICATVTTESGQVYLVDTIDTSGEPHTTDYLVKVATASIDKAQSDFGCQIGSIVTDNAANVAAMRRKMEDDDERDLVTYGCSAHLLNLLAHDLEVPNVKDQILHVIKYFRNNHFACAKHRQEGGNNLIMPQDVRWNTMADCLDAYIKNWSRRDRQRSFMTDFVQ
ncbi:putative AC transposase [Holothuria leucospilota]|uniref:AC transposase n=1 Tax=Holothuria leucospilota TaxID=206669 RepID=A0A9Q1H742_HOLLE|nr:putative AC transposase [Holothuria leucospilota]